MLYSIIPPTLVVLSLAGIVVFLAKKAPQVAKLEDGEEAEEKLGMTDGKSGFFRKLSDGMKNIGAWVGQLFLGLFEKLANGAKTSISKLEAKSKSLNESIRKNKLKKGEVGETGVENNADTDIMDRIREYHPEKRSDKKHKKEKEIVARDEEEIVRPTVSERVTRPRMKAEMKDRLEDLLIERIAANPKDVEAYERLGEYYMEIDSLVDAKECFKQVIKLDPKNGNVKYRMRRLETMMHKR